VQRSVRLVRHAVARETGKPFKCGTPRCAIELGRHPGCLSLAHRDRSLRSTNSVAIGGIADVPLASRAYRGDAHDPSRHLTINFAVMHNGILTLEVLRCPALKFKGSRNCDRVGSFRSDAKISDCRFDLRVPQ
jgi:hypothetical protein